MRKLDIRGIIQPFSFLIVSKVFKEIQEGETLEIMLSGANAATDLLKILPAASYAMIRMEEHNGNEDGVRLHLKKIITKSGDMENSRTADSTHP